MDFTPPNERVSSDQRTRRKSLRNSLGSLHRDVFHFVIDSSEEETGIDFCDTTIGYCDSIYIASSYSETLWCTIVNESEFKIDEICESSMKSFFVK